MKRRMILTNSLVVFFSLVALLVVSVLILFDTANRQAERQVKDYLRIACLLFDGNNMEQTASVLQTAMRPFAFPLLIYKEIFNTIRFMKRRFPIIWIATKSCIWVKVASVTRKRSANKCFILPI